MNAPGTAAEGVFCCLLIVKIYYWCTVKILTISVYFNYIMITDIFLNMDL